MSVFRNRSVIGLAASSLTCVLFAARPAAAATYDAAVDLKTFELANTGAVPAVNGTWSYGTTDRLAPGDPTPNSAGFAQFSTAEHHDAIVLPGVAGGDLQGWQEDTSGDLVPAVAVNVTNHPVGSSCCGTYDVNQMWVHPDPIGATREDAIVRWTAPSAGTITATGHWDNEGGGTSQAYLLVNGVSVGTTPSVSDGVTSGGAVLTTTISVLAGDVIDFATGPNPVNNYGGNSTGFEATVDFTAVPEPGSLAVLGIAGLGLLGRRRH